MLELPHDLNDWFTLIVSAITIIGTIIIIVKGVFKPIWEKVVNFYKRADAMPNKLDATLELLNNRVLPFMESFQYEFSKNSGKSIKDQITRIDNAVRLSELRSKMIADKYLPIGQYECDANGKWTWVNNTMVEIFGLSKDAMLDNGWLTAVKDDERMDVWLNWKRYIEHRIPYEDEFNIISPDGKSYIRVRSSAMALTAIDGKILSYYGDVVKVD